MPRKSYSLQIKLNYEDWQKEPYDTFIEAENKYNEILREMSEDYNLSKASEWAWKAIIRVVSVIGEVPLEVLLYREFK